MGAFIYGIIKAVSGGTIFYYRSRSSGQANQRDLAALRSDWEAVGRDMRSAIVSYRSQSDVKQTELPLGSR